MIGDQLDTDIRGARTFGLDAALISTGVTSTIPASTPPDLWPTYRLPALWS